MMARAICFNGKWFVPTPGSKTILFPLNSTNSYGYPSFKTKTYSLDGRFIRDMELEGDVQIDSQGRKCMPFKNAYLAIVDNQLWTSRSPDLEGWVEVPDDVEVVGGVNSPAIYLLPPLKEVAA